MQQNGVHEDQVTQVRGFADQRLRNPKDPLDPSNRRISLIVRYQNKNDSPADTPAARAQDHGEGQSGRKNAQPTDTEHSH